MTDRNRITVDRNAQIGMRAQLIRGEKGTKTHNIDRDRT